MEILVAIFHTRIVVPSTSSTIYSSFQGDGAYTLQNKLDETVDGDERY